MVTATESLPARNLEHLPLGILRNDSSRNNSFGCEMKSDGLVELELENDTMFGLFALSFLYLTVSTEYSTYLNVDLNVESCRRYLCLSVPWLKFVTISFSKRIKKESLAHATK